MVTSVLAPTTTYHYNPFPVYCRELAPGTVSLTCDRAQGDDSKHDSHYTCNIKSFCVWQTTLVTIKYISIVNPYVPLVGLSE